MKSETININHPTMKIEKIVDAKEFLRALSTNKGRILSSKIILPPLGSDSLGGFKIVYK